ncbi:hypothetical protein SLEP1_g44945 [Rubroshorea leprosula]|uniref:DUF4220 domain-containing protein n=1 Tax=Rubroshorea leprosula TaxID=152421 RepID=A0AAV5LHP2_9ROSI|nr:hypothetical protein SLEP1_g44945 [Rubroshorea leprosula]
MNVFSPAAREFWNVWELRVLVVLSLVLQIVLTVLGNRRKYSHKRWLNFVLWSAYLMADSVVSVALGIISTKIGKMPATRRSLDPDIQLIAFRAPFLLLHLGGPDTITAYSLEDNELWLRHMLWLIVQTAVAFNILLLVWISSTLSYLSLLMIIVGFCKYAERICVLQSASSNNFRKSLLTSPDPGPPYHKFVEEYHFKQAEGYNVLIDDITEPTISEVPTRRGRRLWPREEIDEIRQAHILFPIFKRLFVDLILSFRDRDNSRSVISDARSEEAFQLIEIELGFLYDLLYTKAKAIYTPLGLVRRFISFSLVCVSFFVFIFVVWQHHPTTSEVAVSFLLISSAIFLEIYAALVLISSDETDAWLSNRKIGCVEEIITSLSLEKEPRWSRSTPQLSLLSFFIKEKPLIFPKLHKFLGLDQMLEMCFYETHKEVEEDLKGFIFKSLKERQGQLGDLHSHWGNFQLGDLDWSALKWSIEVDFNQSILIWHIATELCYYSTRMVKEESRNKTRVEIGKQISSYMVYLLLVYPFMLPMGIGEIVFHDTYAEASKFFDERGSSGLSRKQRLLENTRRRKLNAANMLLELKTDIQPKKVKGDRSKSVLFDACRLACSLREFKDKEAKWKMINGIWMGTLTYAASQCRGIHHAKQLRRGGELLTHVWLMMAHFGITNHFQISQGHARAKLTLL